MNITKILIDWRNNPQQFFEHGDTPPSVERIAEALLALEKIERTYREPDNISADTNGTIVFLWHEKEFVYQYYMWDDGENEIIVIKNGGINLRMKISSIE